MVVGEDLGFGPKNHCFCLILMVSCNLYLRYFMDKVMPWHVLMCLFNFHHRRRMPQFQ